MKAHWIVGLVAAAGLAALAAVGSARVAAEQQPQAAPPAAGQPQRGAPPAAIPPPQPRPTVTAPKLPFKVIADFFKYSADMNFGEVLGVAVNSKGHIAVLNHPGSATSGPLYGNASTQILEFDDNGKFVREIGKGVYGFGYGHGIRYDKYDNLWVVDKGTHAITKLNPAGYVTMNLGRRPEGPDEPEWFNPGRQGPAPVHQDGTFRGPTDIAFGPDDSIYISDGYTNSRVAKIDKNGDWVKSWGEKGTKPGEFDTPHSIAADARGNIYVADRGNRRIQVYDTDLNFLKSITSVGAPWSVCTSPLPNQYLFSGDGNGKIYKLDMNGNLVGWAQTSQGHGQTGCLIHELHCDSDTVLYKGDCSTWTVEKITIKGGGRSTTTQ